MIWQNLMKKPVLILGILLFGLFLTQNTTRKWWASYSHRFIPNTCMSLKTRVEEKAPKNWIIECPGTENLIVTLEVKNGSTVDSALKRELYKMLANSYVHFAKLSNPETLELLHHLTIIVDHPELKIISKSEGNRVVKFAGLKRQDQIARHLQNSVRVREVLQ